MILANAQHGQQEPPTANEAAQGTEPDMAEVRQLKPVCVARALECLLIAEAAIRLLEQSWRATMRCGSDR